MIWRLRQLENAEGEWKFLGWMGFQEGVVGSCAGNAACRQLQRLIAIKLTPVSGMRISIGCFYCEQVLEANVGEYNLQPFFCLFLEILYCSVDIHGQLAFYLLANVSYRL